MKLIHTVCPNCGAPIKIDETTQKVVCEFCGITALVDREKNILTEADYENAGYYFEKGRQRAQAEQIDSEKKIGFSGKKEQDYFFKDDAVGRKEKRDPAREGEAINPIRKPIGKLRREADKRNEDTAGGGAWRALDFALYFLTVVLVMFSFRAAILDPVRVEGTSMIQTLGDREVMLVNRTAYAFSAPKRGDIVICYYPEEYYTETSQKYATRVKRVVAVAGDRLEIRDGGVYINGERLSEPYLNGVVTPENDLTAFEDYAPKLSEGNIVPEGMVFVMGDNRPSSRDSRLVGPIPLERVIGRAFAVVYPFRNIRLV